MNSIRHRVHRFPWKAFALLVLVLYFGHWLGASVYQFLDKTTNHFPHHHPWIMSLLGATVLTFLVVVLHRLHHRYPRPKSLLIRVVLWALSTCTVVAAYCAAVWTEHGLKTISILVQYPWIFALLCLLGLLAVNRVLREILRVIEGPEDIQQTDYPAFPPRTLVLLVSLLTKDSLQLPSSGRFASVRAMGTSYQLSGEDINADIVALNGSNWSWQQLLRAISVHSSLERVILIGSKNGRTKGSPGSFDDLKVCQSLLSHYLGKKCQMVLHPVPIPFEDFNDIKSVLRALVLDEARRVGEGRVAIDVTGGQATTSIAAAAATIGTEAIFQYVQTNEPFGVLYYDVRNVHAPNPHGH